jgi:hypothetical protein
MQRQFDYLKQIQEGIEGMRNETWKHFIPHISMRVTKELMQQCGSLVAINDKEVIVGLPSWQLLQRAQEKQHRRILQAAIKTVWGERVKLRLVVSDKRQQ